MSVSSGCPRVGRMHDRRALHAAAALVAVGAGLAAILAVGGVLAAVGAVALVWGIATLARAGVGLAAGRDPGEGRM